MANLLLFFLVPIVLVSSMMPVDTDDSRETPTLIKRHNVTSPGTPIYPNSLMGYSFDNVITRANSDPNGVRTPPAFHCTPLARPESKPRSSSFSSADQQLAASNIQTVPINAVSIVIEDSTNFDKTTVNAVTHVIPVFNTWIINKFSNLTHKRWCSDTETRLTAMPINCNQLTVLISSGAPSPGLRFPPDITISITSHYEIRTIIEYFDHERSGSGLSELTNTIKRKFHPHYGNPTLTIFVNIGSHHMYKLCDYSLASGCVYNRNLLTPKLNAIKSDEPASAGSTPMTGQRKRVPKRRGSGSRKTSTPRQFYSPLPPPRSSAADTYTVPQTPMTPSTGYNHGCAYAPLHDPRIQLLMLACVLAAVFVASTVILLCVLCCCISKSDHKKVPFTKSTRKDRQKTMCSVSSQTGQTHDFKHRPRSTTYELFQQIQMLQQLVQHKLAQETASHQQQYGPFVNDSVHNRLLSFKALF